MKNIGLRNGIRYFVENVQNILSINKGTVGGISIDIVTKEPLSSDSYLYNDNITRDDDYEEIVELTNFNK